MLFLHIFIIIVAFYFLDKVCDDYFIDALDRISQKLKLSPELAGTTFMAIASSAPELAVSLIALFRPGNHESIGMGTIVGSALFNLLVVIGASAMVAHKIHLKWQTVLRDTLFYFIIILLLVVGFWDGKIDLFEAVTFVLLYAIYVFLAVYWRKILPDENFFLKMEKKLVLGWRRTQESIEDKEAGGEKQVCKKRGLFRCLEFGIDVVLGFFFRTREKYWWVFIVSTLFIVGLSWQIVESAIVVAEILHVHEAIIALTVLAVGTSIPDFLTSFIVAKDGRGNMAISNAVGSNIFDILFGLGFPWLLVILIRQQEVTLNKADLGTSVLLLCGFVVLFFAISGFQKWRINFWGGLVLILGYVGYLVWKISEVLI